MKTPTDNIFQLIDSMTASEKRYFKRHYSSEKSLITSLFDYINGQNEYNEEDVKKYFSDTKLAKNLKVYKVQLAEVLLKSLTSYYNKKSMQSKIRMGLEEIDILINKRLFNLAYTKVKRIKNICIKGEAYEHIFPILAIEQTLNNFYSADYDETRTTNFELLKNSLNEVTRVAYLKHYSHQLSDIKNHILTSPLSKKSIAYFRNMLKEELPKLQLEGISTRERYYRYHIIAIIYRLTEQDLSKEHYYKKAQYKMMKEVPFFVASYPKLYFASCYNYMNCCWKLGDYNETEQIISEISAFVDKYPLLESNLLFVYFMQFNLMSCKGFSQYDPAFETSVMEHISKHKQKEDFLASLFYLNFALLHLALNQHDKVQFYLRRLSNNLNTLSEAYTQLMYIIELVSHYESKDFSILRNAINSHLRKLKKNTRLNEDNNTFTDLIYFFQKIIRPDNQKRISQLALNFKSEKHRYHSGPLHNLIQEYGFAYWLKSLINQEDLDITFVDRYNKAIQKQVFSQPY